MVYRTNTYNNRDEPLTSAWNALVHSEYLPDYLYNYFVDNVGIQDELYYLQESYDTFVHGTPIEREVMYREFFEYFHLDRVNCCVWVCDNRAPVLSRERYGRNLTNENQGIIRCSEKNARVIFRNDTDILLGFYDPPVFTRDIMSNNLISQEELERVNSIERAYNLKFKTNLKKDVYNLFKLVDNGLAKPVEKEPKQQNQTIQTYEDMIQDLL